MDSQFLFSTASNFQLDGEPSLIERHGAGHIHKTYLVTSKSGKRYILQRIAESAFRDVDALMENIRRICGYMSKHASDPRAAMRLISTKDGRPYLRNEEGAYRVYENIEGSVCLQSPESGADFYEAGVAFGNFLHVLEGFPVGTLYETIPRFHDTPDRFRIFKESIEKDIAGRAKSCKEEIRFLLERERDCGQLVGLLAAKELPLRVTHNDAKLNNVLFDRATRKALCVIDLDTTMPGLAAYDFGDAVRFGAATAGEDETDLSKMTLDMELYSLFARGFAGACADLSPKEIETLPLGARIITLEQAARFLTDYIDGDKYYSDIKFPEHNLARARAQIKLAQEMEKNWSGMVMCS